MKPSEVNLKTKDKVFKNLYGSYFDNEINFKFRPGNYVRIAVEKSLFEKGYTPNWSLDVYIVSKLIPSNPPTYLIKSLNDEEFSKKYYNEELQLVSETQFPYNTFKVIKENKTNFLIQKLNSENKESIWIKKSELNEFEPSDPEVENKKQEDFKRITRSQVKK
jgi:hypothetical protein